MKTYFYLRRKFGKQPSALMRYSTAFSEKERQIVIADYKKRYAKGWELVERDS